MIVAPRLYVGRDSDTNLRRDRLTSVVIPLAASKFDSTYTLFLPLHQRHAVAQIFELSGDSVWRTWPHHDCWRRDSEDFGANAIVGLSVANATKIRNLEGTFNYVDVGTSQAQVSGGASYAWSTTDGKT